MNCDAPLPRVNWQIMQGYINQRVLLVGKIESINDNLMVLSTSDRQAVNVQAKPEPFDTAFVEIEGFVRDTNTLEEVSHVSFGENFDLALYNEMVKLAHGQHKDMFLP